MAKLNVFANFVYMADLFGMIYFIGRRGISMGNLEQAILKLSSWNYLQKTQEIDVKVEL